VAFDSCEVMPQALWDAVAREVTPYGLCGHGGTGLLAPTDSVGPVGTDTTESRTGAAPDRPGPDRSTTNVHEAGVDEPDPVKTDGRRLVTVLGGRLRVVDLVTHDPTATLAVLSVDLAHGLGTGLHPSRDPGHSVGVLDPHVTGGPSLGGQGKGGTVGYSVGQVARLAGVTVRTLHHYDEIGLLTPSERTAAGYRRYGDADLARLQQILFYRELGFPLEEITAILDDPQADALSHLRRQHELLTERIVRLQWMVVAVEKAMEAQQMGISLTPEERFEVFGGEFAEKYEEYQQEAEERWGDTDAWAQSRRRVAGYTKADWQRYKAEQEDFGRRLLAAFQRGVAADSEEAMDLAEEHRRIISRWFYDCTYEIHRGLAEMYLADPRFTAYYEGIAPGLARFVSDAIRANADRAAAH